MAQQTLHVVGGTLIVETVGLTFQWATFPILKPNVAMAPTPIGTPGGGIGPYTYANPVGFPPGLSLSPAGVLSGTPTTVGAYTNMGFDLGDGTP
jgi:hypothetical protein